MFIHVIGICLPSHSASEKHDEEKKGPYTFAHFVNFQKMCLPYLIIVAFWVTLKRQIVPVAFPPWLPLSPPIPGHMVREPPRYMFNVSSTCSRCCFLIKKSCFVDYWLNKLFHKFSLRDLHFLLCSLELDKLWVQRIMGFFILITHKLTRSDNLITWATMPNTFSWKTVSDDSVKHWYYIRCHWKVKRATVLHM